MIRSIGLRTELEIGTEELLEREGYLVARTPSNPTFMWGNILVFDRPPRAEDIAPGGGWMLAFEREFPDALHRSFTWDGDATEPDVAPHFVVDASYVYRHREPHRLRASSRTVVTTDWKRVLELLDVCFSPRARNVERHRIFLARTVARYEHLVSSNRGRWFGLFEDGELLSTCGLFDCGEHARFQLVATRPEKRGRGLASEIVAHVARTSDRIPIITADAKGSASRIYERLGFERFETMIGILRYPD